MTDWEAEAEDMLTRDMSIVPVIRGIEKKERVKAYWNVANRLDCPTRIREHIQYRMEAIKEKESV